MPKQTTRLSDMQIKKAKIKSKEYILADGNGLNIRIRPNGTKSWQFRYTDPITGKVKKIPLGSYSNLDLADARKIAQEHRNKVANGIDPKQHIKELKKEASRRESSAFGVVAEQWFQRKKNSISAQHANRTWRTLEKYILPKLQNVPLEAITRRDTIQTLRPLEKEQKLSTIKRICQSLNQIMEYGVDCGIIEANPLTRMINAFQRHQVEHMPTIEPKMLKQFIRKLHDNNTLHYQTKHLLLWQLHTILRPNEAVETRWENVCIENKCLVMPGEVMKNSKIHRIPLTDEMIEILDNMRPFSEGKEFVFPSLRKPLGHMSEFTVNAAIKRSLGYKGELVAHGLRAIASTALHEEGFDTLHIEACLSHSDKNTTRASYNRSDFFEQRKEIMAWWSKFITSA